MILTCDQCHNSISEKEIGVSIRYPTDSVVCINCVYKDNPEEITLCQRCNTEINDGCCSAHDGDYCDDCCQEVKKENMISWFEGRQDD